MNLAIFSKRGTSPRNPNLNTTRRPAASTTRPALIALPAAADRKRNTLVAVWQINPQSGRVECHWTADSNEIAQWWSRPRTQRAGLILAAAQQSAAMRGTKI